MRLFIHLVDSQDTIHDLEGVEVTDLEQARTEAIRALADMRQEDPSAPQAWSGWTLRLTDGSGRVVLSFGLDAGVH
jgi:hypothetical protein